jgi:hypothetical protein
VRSFDSNESFSPNLQWELIDESWLDATDSRAELFATSIAWDGGCQRVPAELLRRRSGGQ